MRDNAKPSSAGGSPGRGGGRLALALTAAFALAFFLIPVAQAAAVPGTLKVNIAGTGSGEVKSFEGGAPNTSEATPPIACSSGICESTMGEVNQEFTESGFTGGVWLEAIPALGSEFTGWTTEEGMGFFGTSSGCEFLLMVAIECSEGTEWAYGTEEFPNAKVAATFEATGPPPSYTLTLEKEGTGEGWVTSTPAGINCGLACTTPRSAEFEEGTVTLHAYGREFAGWAVCPGTEGGTQNRDCEVSSIEEAKVAKATFTDKYALTVSKTGTGNGWVVSTPAGINCGLACTTPRTAYFWESTSVELYVYGSQFTGWTACPGIEGGLKNGKNRKCTIEMIGDTEAEPNFTA